MSELYLRLVDQSESESEDPNDSSAKRLRFQGIDSYVRYLAHVLNLIVTDILASLKSGNRASAEHACDLMNSSQDIGSHSALSRLRIMALWISRTPQRKQQWKILCRANNLKAKMIEYDVDTRWNSTYRMIRDALEAKQQIRMEQNQTCFPQFTADYWLLLRQIATVLAKFEKFTLTISKREPQISLAIPIYYELQDMLDDAASRQGEFSGLDLDIAQAVSAGLKKYNKIIISWTRRTRFTLP
ncbi:hypothetical protein V1505DRAFT_358692 [Lipomyces doorenjongii]